MFGWERPRASRSRLGMLGSWATRAQALAVYFAAFRKRESRPGGSIDQACVPSTDKSLRPHHRLISNTSLLAQRNGCMNEPNGGDT